MNAARISRGMGLGCLVLLAWARLGAAEIAPPELAVRVADGEVQVGTDSSAPYYLQWCTPMGDWENWNENSRIDPATPAVWFRGWFEDIEAEEPMLYDPPEDVSFYSDAVEEPEADGVTWVTVGMPDGEGNIVGTATRDLMAVESSYDPPVYADPLNNQAVATPDPGRVKLYWRNRSSNRAFIWHLGDTAARKAATAVYDLNLASGWIIAATADIDGDGDHDIIWYNTGTGRVFVWFLDPDGVRSGTQAVCDVNLATTWRIDAVADIDGDDVPDLLWRNRDSNRAYIWFLNADGTRKSHGAVYDLNLPVGWEIVGLNDIDQDGTPDIVWCNRYTRRAYIWFLNSDGTRKDHGPVFELNLPSGWEVAGVEDIDGDGPGDIVWFNTGTRRTYIWFLNADGTRKSHGAVYDVNLPAGWEIAGLRDVDSDGTPDIVWFNTGTRRVYVWFLNSDGTRKDHGAVYDLNLGSDWGIDSVDY
ncbi:MAG: VCBS repeat-containing protein [Lentisphaerae bacterium]|nr:VCBS repeat-containing protein [Lentisphaerota bacterium]